MDKYQARTDFELEAINLREVVRVAGFYASGVSVAGPVIAGVLELLPTITVAIAAYLWLTGFYASAVALLGTAWLTLHLRLSSLVAGRKHSRGWVLPSLMVALGTLAAFVFVGGAMVVILAEFIEGLEPAHHV